MKKSANLRKHRISLKGRFYIVTAVTFDRRNIFSNLYNARALINSFRQSDIEGITGTIAFVVMPDHFHWLFRLDAIREISTVVGMVKGRCSRYLDNPHKKQVWQSNFYDHMIRSEDDLINQARYIVANPLRANIVKSLKQYTHWDCIYL